MPKSSVVAAHDVRIIENYTTTDAVELYLTGILTDIVGADPLSKVLTSAERTAILTSYLRRAGNKVRRKAKRDFGFHENVEVYVDGGGSDVLDLGINGFWPLYEVSNMLYVTGTSTSQVSDISDLNVDRTGVIQWPNRTTGGPTFLRGLKNVKLTISWGYSDTVEGAAPVPDEIKDAQALYAAADILSWIQATKNADGVGGVTQVFQDQIRVMVSEAGRFRATIKNWETEADKICISYQSFKVTILSPYQPFSYGRDILSAR